jgi:hypothetical protein
MRVLHRLTPGQYTVAMVVTLKTARLVSITLRASPGTGGHAM